MVDLNKIKVWVIEDELLVAEDIEIKLLKSGYEVTGKFTTGEEAIQSLDEGNIPDFIIMDIHLSGELDGIQTVEVINGKHPVPVIYLTDDHHRKTLMRARKTQPASYLVKPFNEYQLSAAIEMAFFDFQLDDEPQSDSLNHFRINDAIFIKVKNRFVKLNLADVIRLDGDRMYTDIITSKKIFKVTGSINHVKKYFHDPFFIKVHRSHVVNLNRITSFEGNTIFFDTGSVTVSRQYRDGFFKRLRII